MSWSHLGQVATTGNITGNQTSITATTSADIEADHIAIVLIGKDNAQTSGGDIAEEVRDVTDSAGNHFTKVRNEANAGTAQAATVCCAWFLQYPATLASGGTITATFGATTTANDAQTMIVQEFSVSAGSAVRLISSTGLATDAADPAAITLGSLASAEYLWIHGLSCEGESTDGYTWDSDYTQFTVAGANSGSAATSQHITGGFRVMTGTTDTVDVTSTTADRDYAQVLFVLKEITTGSTGGPVQLVNSGGLVG